MTNRSELPIQTLHLSDRDKAKLLWAIDQADNIDVQPDKRRLRVTCTNNEAVLTLKSDGGGETKLAMLARNLGRWGAALVHGRYIHLNSRCELSLQANNSMWHSMLGTVRHIRHIQGTVHELGVVFDEPIDLSEFVSLSPSEETCYLRELADSMPETDGTEVVELTNRVLVIDDFASDRKLMSHWLTQAGLSVMGASNARGAMVQVQEQIYDMLLVDYKLGTSSGIELIRELRETQFTAPIIAMSSDESAEAEQGMLDAGADLFMKKPFAAKQLIAATYELIGIDATADIEPIFSKHKNDADMRPLLTEFTRGLAGYIDELRDANAQGNYDALESISHRLKGAGQGYGFDIISQQSAELLNTLNSEDVQIDAIRKTTTELISILNRVKLS
ncbi:MAG: response regulator [Phycisphaeraceae bacterium]